MADEETTLVLEETTDAMDKTVASYRKELLKVRTGRASTALLDGVQIDYHGVPTPLNQLANLTTPDPRLIVINPYDKSCISAIERAIQTSDLGLQPSSDGKLVRIAIPPLNEERRKQLVKQVRRAAEDHRVGVREGRRDALGLLKDLESDGGVSKDDCKRAEKKVQDLTDDFVKKIDELTVQKEKEVLEV